MEKFKVCPICGKKNAPTMLECMECETDLTGIPIWKDIVISDNATDAHPADEMKSRKMVRVCECGAKNSPSIRKCSVCGEDISDILPVEDTATEEAFPSQTHFIVASLDGLYSFEFTLNTTIIGRENTMKEYLVTKPYVSRKHAEILREAGKLWIKSYKTTNHTYVNNERIDDERFFELHDGDVIGFGGKEINNSVQEQAAYFRVRIGPCI